jgi:hypothetical protein
MSYKSLAAPMAIALIGLATGRASAAETGGKASSLAAFLNKHDMRIRVYHARGTSYADVVQRRPTNKTFSFRNKEGLRFGTFGHGDDAGRAVKNLVEKLADRSIVVSDGDSASSETYTVRSDEQIPRWIQSRARTKY